MRGLYTEKRFFSSKTRDKMQLVRRRDEKNGLSTAQTVFLIVRGFAAPLFK